MSDTKGPEDYLVLVSTLAAIIDSAVEMVYSADYLGGEGRLRRGDRPPVLAVVPAYQPPRHPAPGETWPRAGGRL